MAGLNYNDTNVFPITSAPANPGDIKNLGMTLSGGVLTITDQNGGTLSSSNPGYVGVPSTTGGLSKTLQVLTNHTLRDDANASSDLTGLGWGITEGVDWMQDTPFFLYVVNKGNSNIDGNDGSSQFFITRVPGMNITPASADDIGDTGTIPTNDSEVVILILNDVTVANYTSLPCTMIGTFRMRWSSANTDWTIQTLGNTDGIGMNAIQTTCSKHWNFPTGQNGAASGNYMLANGGTAPVFTTIEYYYRVLPTGHCQIEVHLNGDGGTDGSGAVTALIAIPFQVRAPFSGIAVWGPAIVTAAGLGTFAATLSNASGNRTMIIQDTATVTNANFSNGGRTIRTSAIYPIINP